MRVKIYTVRGLSVRNGNRAMVDLTLEFEGKRAFVIWDTIRCGDYALKARLEINPKFLARVNRTSCDYIYSGNLILPRPEDN